MSALSAVLLVLTLLFSPLRQPGNMPAFVSPAQPGLSSAEPLGSPSGGTAQATPPPVRRVNAPHFPGAVSFAQSAIFWFGRVAPNDTYTDVRVGYNAQELFVALTVFDRRLWYNPSPSPADLMNWDAATLYLDTGGQAGDAPGASSYRLVSQINSWETSRGAWQAAYRGNGSTWTTSGLQFTTESGMRGDAPNNDVDDRGWLLYFHVPFASLGFAGPPAEGTLWRMAIAVHNRIDAANTPTPIRTWPEDAALDRPVTWGGLEFGLPAYTPPPAVAQQSVTIRHKLNGAVVADADVGGGTTCGDGLDFWTQWGETNYAGVGFANVQNQLDVADWPCFSKYYVTFPLNSLPPGKIIVAATLTLHQFGNAGQGYDPGPQPSFIQVLTVGQDWSESSLTWNNAPLALENIGGISVDPLPATPPAPGVAREWNISRAVAAAYTAGSPLRLALYSADYAQHSGKYFTTSETDDYIAEARPTITVVWGNPEAVVHQTVRPHTVSTGQSVAFTLDMTGNGQAMTLMDPLPTQISAPDALRVEGGPAATYDAQTHRLTWTGSPPAGQAVTITFSATILADGPATVANTATLTDAAGHVSSDTAMLFVRGCQLQVPLLRK